MAWVRYDDQFPNHPKVTGVVVDDPGAMGLHVLANTWTNAQKKHHGFVPEHQPGVLVCDRELGARWAAVLVKHGLWHKVPGPLCGDCEEEYAELPDTSTGFVFHNARDFRPPDRYRVVRGTPADLSEKRREAGRRGGQASAARREQGKQTARANREQTVSNDSNSASNGQVRDDVREVCEYLAQWIIRNESKPPANPLSKRWVDSARLLIDVDGRTVEQIKKAIDWCQADEFWKANILSMPKLREKYDQIRLAAQRAQQRASPPRSQPAASETELLEGWGAK